jgi:hypothetical protein
VLILGKAIGLSWPTIKAILLMRVAKGIPAGEMSKSRAVFDRLEVATAQEIVRFYQKSEGMGINTGRPH